MKTTITDLKDFNIWVVQNGKATPGGLSYPIINASTLKNGIYDTTTHYVGEGFAGLALFVKK